MLFKHSTRLKTFSLPSVFQLGLVIMASLYVATLSFSSESSDESVPQNLSHILSTRSKETGENFVLTKHALAREYHTTTRAQLDSQFQSIVINGWTVLYLPDEDISMIEGRARKNKSVWKSSLAHSALDRRPMTFSFWHADIAQVNVMVWRACGVKLEFSSPQRAFLSFVAAKGIPTGDFCRDYMLILAANDIVVRQKGGRLIAELDDADR